ncbi:MAG TPA: flagellar hook-associated protein FlgL [Steroidobacteraceae bacterium]
MRISTSALHSNALTAMLSQQAALSKTQNQIATGRRVQTPADDPVASAHIMELERALSESAQYASNADMARNRLVLEEQALADVTSLLHRVRELAIQGNNATVDPASRRMIAAEVRDRLRELVDIANRRDGNGEYLFSGYSTTTQPFVQTGSTVSYFGDQGSRTLQVGPNQRVADSHSGYDVFMMIREGNGVFTTAAAATNTGSGVIASGSVFDPAQWVADDYTLRFTSATGDYEIVDSSATVVATGTYTSGEAISFRGVNINMSGMPAANDTFSIERSRTEDLFTTLGNLAATLESSTATEADRALFNTNMARALAQLDQSADRISTVRAEVGTRLSSLETTQSSIEDRKVELEQTVSQLRDLDYAEAITRMNQQLVGLQAAQLSYSQISQLSLFQYLK